MAVDVQTHIVIARPRAEVAAWTMDPDHAPDWYVNIKTVEWRSERPLRVGSIVGFVAHFLGRRMAYDYEMIELIPGERLVMRTAEGPFPMETTYTFTDAAEGGTAVTLGNRGEPSGFGKVTAPLMAAMMARANRNDLDRLKELLEAR
jgi:uncharacterized protein YndB with AHSA1/START domain